jgi:cell division protein DivIC
MINDLQCESFIIHHSSFISMFQKLLHYGRNFYIATGLGLLAWMTFFDANDLPTQIRNYWKLHELDQDTRYYQDKIKLVQTERKELLGNDRLREKFAREKYLMKKEGEDVFVIVDEHNEPLEK